MKRPELHGAYEREQVEELLPQFFHGGTQWSRKDAPDADMPKAKTNPKLGGTWMAVNVDLGRALAALLRAEALADPVALWRYYAESWTEREIAAAYGIPQQTVNYRLVADVGRLRDAMNKGRR